MSLMYVAAYVGLVGLSPYPESGAASVVLSGMRVGMTVAAVAARGVRYLALAIIVSGFARLGAGGALSDWLNLRLLGVSISLLLAGLLFRWLSSRLELQASGARYALQIYADDGHGLPLNRADRIRRIVEWFSQAP